MSSILPWQEILFGIVQKRIVKRQWICYTHKFDTTSNEHVKENLERKWKINTIQLRVGVVRAFIMPQKGAGVVGSNLGVEREWKINITSTTCGCS